MKTHIYKDFPAIWRVSDGYFLLLIDGPSKVPAPVMARTGAKHLDPLPTENCQMLLPVRRDLVLQVLAHQP